MSESEGQRSGSPLLSGRGATTISDTVVSSIAGMAVQEVEGVHMGGGGSRTASGVIGSLTGSEGKTGGISVEVGATEAAIDLKMGIEYGRNILQTVEEVRRRITERVEGLTGLRIKELNATITDITFPEKEESAASGRGDPRARAAPKTRQIPHPRRERCRRASSGRRERARGHRGRAHQPNPHRGRKWASTRGRGQRGGPPTGGRRDHASA